MAFQNGLSALAVSILPVGFRTGGGFGCCEGGCSPKNGNCEGYVCFELDEMFLLESVSLNDSTSLIWLFEESFRGGEVKSISISLSFSMVAESPL